MESPLIRQTNYEFSLAEKSDGDALKLKVACLYACDVHLFGHEF